MSETVCIADVDIVIEGSDTVLRDVLADALNGRPRRPHSPVVGSVRVGMTPDALEMPLSPPDDERASLGIQLWTAPSGPVAFRDGISMAVDVDARHVTIGGFDPDRHDPWSLAVLGWIGLGWVMASHRRYVLHAAAIGRASDALLVVGHSGAGKSTATFAALEAGWWALADDSIVVEPDGDVIFAHGVHRPPSAPTEIGGRLIAGSRRHDDPRRRGSVSADLLSTRRARIAGVVVVGHSVEPDGTCTRIPGHESLPLLMLSCGPASDGRFRRDYMGIAASLARLPVWALGHALDPTDRLAAAAAHLAGCLREVSLD